MKTGHIIMSINELERSDAFLKLKEKILTQTQVAELLGISVRQVKRIFKKYKNHETAALISKKRGQKGNRRLAESLKDLALAWGVTNSLKTCRIHQCISSLFTCNFFNSVFFPPRPKSFSSLGK